MWTREADGAVVLLGSIFRTAAATGVSCAVNSFPVEPLNY